jgi:Cu(I)/Ag(I) efflux system membrane fusion protein
MVMINPVKQQLIGVKKYTVAKKKLVKIIRTVGRVEYDERLVREVNLKVEGWVERLYADYTGKYVRKGEPLFKLYSPELLNAQEEYLLAISGRISSSLKSSAKTKLLLWDISESQINQLERSKKPATWIDILSPSSGYIISKSIIEGSHVNPGENLLHIADIKKVWIIGDIYEYELAFIKRGQKVTITSQSFPGQHYSGTISYIYPDLNLQTRSVKIRIEMQNPDELFKPGMFTNIQIEVDKGSHLAVPESAVLNSGIRQVVFISKGDGVFIPYEVDTGPLINGYYPIKKGLKKGDVVVSSANFFLDSESKLTATMEGMMGLVGMGDWKMEHSKMGEMDMSGMDMSGMKMGEGSDSKNKGTMNMQEGDKNEGKTE